MKAVYIFLFLFFINLNAQQILPERQRAEVVDNILKNRFNNFSFNLFGGKGELHSLIRLQRLC